MIRILLKLSVAILLLVASVCAQQKPAVPADNPQPNANPAPLAATDSFSQRHPRYKLDSGDVLDLSFTFTPEFNQAVAVQPDGFVALKEVGDFHVQGKSVDEVSQMLKSAYSKILHDPVITVSLKEFVKPFVVVGGHVKVPGKYDFHVGTTLTQAVALAGGFTDSSKHSEVWLYRRGSDGQVISTKFDVKRIMARGEFNEDIILDPGDTIYVPQNTFSKIKDVVVPHTSLGLRP